MYCLSRGHQHIAHKFYRQIIFLNYIIGIYKVETDENENYENTETILLSTHFGI